MTCRCCNTPPADRHPILTYVGGYDERVAVEAIRRELLREGQVFWVHNRVSSIEQAAARLRELVPEARIAVAHGQMDEGALEQVVVDFWDGAYDVLVCTTIIESGIDMPTVNTLVVERADLLGLGQLHQLRGRVGRSGQRAYAYLFHPPEVALSEEAYERLKTIGEATELGSGFKIAMRDLEIRGAGNLLGEAQSGHIAAVGYDLYCQMVTEAVAEMKGEPPPVVGEIRLDVPTDANLPHDYIANETARLEAYRRLAAVTTPAEVEDIAAEWLDRYGPIPPLAEALLDVARLRAECHRLGLTEVTISTRSFGPGEARLGPLELKLSEATRLRRLARQAKYKEEQRQLVLPIPRRSGRCPEIAAGAGVVPRQLPPRVDPCRFCAVIGRVALVFAAVVATGVDGHRVAAAGDAATVNGVSITVDEFDDFVTALADAGLTQFAPSPTSRTIDGDAGRSLLTVLVMNEARGQFLDDAGEEPVTEADIEAVFENLAADHPLQSLEGDARAAVAEDQVYVDRLNAIEPDVSTMGEQYEESPASLGVYCATAISVADARAGRCGHRGGRGWSDSRRTRVASQSPTGSARRWRPSPIRSCRPASSQPDRVRRSGRRAPATVWSCS